VGEHYMMQAIKEIIKTRPQLYDLAKRVRRRLVSLKADPVYRFFDEFSRSHNREVNFIQIGASDGLRWDPIREFILRDRWSGILVEPLPNVFEILKKNYRNARKCNLVFVNAAISSSTSNDMSFWTFSDSFLNNLRLEERIICSHKSSFDRKHLERWAKLYETCDKAINEIRVPCLTLDRLVIEYWDKRKVDLLVIDAEGHESSIISGIDFNILNPDAIYFESHNLGSEKDKVFRFLSNHNYKVIEIAGDSAAIRAPQILV
jgi:FkbM family methyltransferase